jgi:uroporphyrinogen-III synthase
VRERTELTPEIVAQRIEGLQAGDYYCVVFMTGVSVSILFELAEQLGRRADLVAGLGRVITVCRGPKPTAALRGFGVPPTLTAKSSFTSAEVVDALSGVELKDRSVLLFHYGERSETVAETLRARGGRLDEQWVYRWLLPEDRSDLERLIVRIVQGDVQALAITCQIQFRHLLQVAEELQLGQELVQALNHRVVVGAVGPTCAAVLESYDVAVEVMPEHPKMGPLIMALMRYLDRGRRGEFASRPEHPALAS